MDDERFGIGVECRVSKTPHKPHSSGSLMGQNSMKDDSMSSSFDGPNGVGDENRVDIRNLRPFLHLVYVVDGLA